MSRKLGKNHIKKEIKAMIREENLDYYTSAAEHIRRSAENLIIKIIKDASYYKEKSECVINKSDIVLALALDKEARTPMGPLSTTEIMDIADEYNCNTIEMKENYGLKIPKDSLGGCNYQLENPKKKMKIQLEAAHKLENYRNRNMAAAGNCFKFLVNYKNHNNMGSYVVKNSNPMRDVPLKFTIRPKYNMYPNMSMLRKNNQY